jgi:hypothetical protein
MPMSGVLKFLDENNLNEKTSDSTRFTTPRAECVVRLLTVCVAIDSFVG